MEMTNKFLVFDLQTGGYAQKDGQHSFDLDIKNSALYSKKSAEEYGINIADERSYLLIPVTKDFVESIPFDLSDTDPETPHSETYDNEEALKGDFIVMTEYGFYDERYNSLTGTSRPKIRSFDLDYANLYNMESLKQTGTEWIADDGFVIPISDAQQEELKKLPAFAEEYGFFMKPIGEQPQQDPDLADFNEALADLELETNKDKMER